MTGTVKAINERGFGFIGMAGGPDCFFHRSDLHESLEFDERLIERRVTFETVETERGMRAANVRPATD